MISHHERSEVSRRPVFAETRGILAKYAEEERRRETEGEREKERQLLRVGDGRARPKAAEAGPGSETRSGIHAARHSGECVYARLFVVVRFVPRARRDHSVALITQRVAMRARSRARARV